MSRIQELFKTTDHKILNVYVTAGYPEMESTLPLIRTLESAGADIVELGMPYSDPLADGPVIQQSSSIALANGMTMEKLFDQLKELRPGSAIPVILMGYMNPVLQFGFERFCEQAASSGVDGLILPDMPEYEFEEHYRSIIQKHGLDFIFLVTPETSEKRIRHLDELSSGFLYAVSSSSTTGGDKDMNPVSDYLKGLAAMGLKNPVLVGFGIRDKASFATACENAQGAIIGSAFVQALGKAAAPLDAARQFVESIRS